MFDFGHTSDNLLIFRANQQICSHNGTVIVPAQMPPDKHRIKQIVDQACPSRRTFQVHQEAALDAWAASENLL